MSNNGHTEELIYLGVVRKIFNVTRMSFLNEIRYFYWNNEIEWIIYNVCLSKKEIHFFLIFAIRQRFISFEKLIFLNSNVGLIGLFQCINLFGFKKIY